MDKVAIRANPARLGCSGLLSGEKRSIIIVFCSDYLCRIIELSLTL